MTGRYERRRSPQQKRNIRQLALLLAMVLLLGVGTGATVAYLMANSRSVTNSFEPGSVDCVVKEDYSIQVTADSDVDGYIRAAILINWVDGDGNVYAIAPQGISVTTGDGWAQEEDGYYYYSVAVSPGNSTNPLINELQQPANMTAPEGYSLQVEILAEVIQAKGGAGHTASDWGKSPVS